MSMTNWPFVPQCLTEVLPEDLVRFIQSGSAIRMNMPVVIVELATEDGRAVPRYIPADDEWLQFSSFCEYLRGPRRRDLPRHFPGATEACHASDCSEARKWIEHGRGSWPSRVAAFKCHMGLCDIAAPIVVGGRRVAVMFAGQRLPEAETEIATIQANAEAIGTPRMPSITVGVGSKAELVNHIRQTQPFSKDLLDVLEREAYRIAEFAERHRQLRKLEQQESFLNSLKLRDPGNREDLLAGLQKLVEQVALWTGAAAVCTFVTETTGQNVLKLMASRGIRPEICSDPPHFNWSKGGLPDTSVELTQVPQPNAYARGIKGNASAAFNDDVDLIIPFAITKQYRAAFCIGGLPEGVSLKEESSFLCRLARTVCGTYLDHLHVLELSEREEQWEDAAGLIAHHVRGSLNPIKAEDSLLRDYMEAKPQWVPTDRAKKAVSVIEAEADALAEFSNEALEFWRLIMGRGERKFQKKSLAKIVMDCVDRMRPYAEHEGLTVRVDPRVDALPVVDTIARTLDVAFVNLLENAIKYSFDGRFIEVRGYVDGDSASVDIEDYGIGIPEDERAKVFTKRYRGKHRGRKSRKQGEGLGAWQAAEVARAHGGTITCSSQSRDRLATSDDVSGFRTVFTLTIPIRQTD